MSRVLVAGAGALGSVLGGFLQRAGHAVTLLGRSPHLEAIARTGLAVDGIWGAHRVGGFTLATRAGELEGTYDAILVTVKSFDTEATSAAVAPLLAPDGVAISLQNGLGNVETVESAVGPARTLGARVIFGARLPAPGRVRVTVFADPTAIGALAPGRYPRRDALAATWAHALDQAGVPTVTTDRLGALLWAKVLYNAALNPLGALLGLHYGALAEDDDSRAIMDRVIDEAFAVAAVEGVRLAWPTVAAYREEFYGRLVPATADHRSSMLQDLERGRRTEIAAINGAVWGRARPHGLPTPVNETLTRLIRLREHRPRRG